MYCNVFSSMHSPYCNVMYFPQCTHHNAMQCTFPNQTSEFCVLSMSVQCSPVISHLIKQTSGPQSVPCNIRLAVTGSSVRFKSSFFYMFAFRTLRYVLKKYSTCDLPTHYRVCVTFLHTIQYVWPSYTLYSMYDLPTHYTVCVTFLHTIQYVWPSYTLYTMCDLPIHYTVCVTFLHTIQYVWPSYTLYHRQKSLQRKWRILS